MGDPAAPRVEISSLAYDSRTVRSGRALLLRARLHARRARARSAGGRERRGGARGRAPAGAGSARGRGSLRPRGDGAGGRALPRRPQRGAQRRRGHGYQRQDDHRLPAALAARGVGPALRTAGHGEERDRRRRAPGRAHHARGDRPAAPAARDGRRRRRRMRDGDLLARPGARPRTGDPLRRRGLHQPDPGPPRLPSDDGGLLRGQAAAVRGRRRAAGRDPQPRRPLRPSSAATTARTRSASRSRIRTRPTGRARSRSASRARASSPRPPRGRCGCARRCPGASTS